MSEVTQILKQIQHGDHSGAEQLLPLVYEELRRLAAAKMAQEHPGQTLSATSLVHDAYLRLVDVAEAQEWDSTGHFFTAAAEAMRRILVENARRKQSSKRGGDLQRLNFHESISVEESPAIEVLALNEALDELDQHDHQAAEIVKLRFFAGLSHQEAASALNVSRRSADRLWTVAKTWLFRRICDDD